MSGLIQKISPRANTWGNIKAVAVPSGTTISQTLQNLNQYTLGIYARKKAQVRGQLGKGIPVILANQNYLSSRYRNIRRDVEYVPEQYHLLKALAHIPIAVHTVLALQDAQELVRLRGKMEGLFRPYQECSNAG